MLKTYPAINSHEEYLTMLSLLEEQTTQIEYALVDPKDTAFVALFSSDIVWEKEATQWWGTGKSRKTKLYRIKASRKLFAELRKYDTFFRCTVTGPRKKIVYQQTDFGVNDIAFFDSVHSEPLLHTVTHEGCLFVSDALKLKN